MVAFAKSKVKVLAKGVFLMVLKSDPFIWGILCGKTGFASPLNLRILHHQHYFVRKY